MSGRVVALGLVLAVVLGACTTSELDPDADVTISALVQTRTGRAAGGAAVALVREPTAADVFGGLGVGFASLGAACLVDPPPRLCDDANTRRADADDSGRVAFELKGRDTQDTLGFANTFQLTALLPAQGDQLEGPATSASFLVQREELALPALRAFAPRRSLDAGRGTVRVGWDVPGWLRGVSHRQVSFDDGGTGLVWSQPATGRSAALDGRLLEDAAGGYAITLTREVPGPATTFTIGHRSSRDPYISDAPLPVTRGRPCRIDGQPPVVPCPLTDGAFAPMGTGSQGAVILLGRRERITLVAVRGCDGECPVALSGNGRRWSTVATVRAPFAAVHLAGRQAAFIRVRADLPDELTEVSAWTGRPPARATVAQPASGRSDALRPKISTGGSGGLDSTVVLAVGLAAAAALGGFVLGLLTRRRRRA